MPAVKIYMTRSCGYCRMALNLLEKRGVDPDRIMVDSEPGLRRTMMELSGRTSVPQIFIGENHVGGYDDLVELDMDGELKDLLEKASNTAQLPDPQ